MRIAVRSRFTNIHGGYVEDSTSSRPRQKPVFRRSLGGSCIFHGQTGSGHEARWYFAPAPPVAGSLPNSVFFSSINDAPTPDAAQWPEPVERIWQPSAEALSGAGKARQGLFTDADFPPDGRSIGHVLPHGLKTPMWLPVRELRRGRWDIFGEAVSANDLLQGAIGNCWLVAAMACLAEFPAALEKLFDQRQLTTQGRYTIHLHSTACEHQAIVIDEYIPCHAREWWDEEGVPLFARPNGNEAWVLLLEKAFAKMSGSYAALNGGTCCSAFRAFTGEKNVYVWARSDGETARVDGNWKRMELATGGSHFVWTPGLEERRDDGGLWAEVHEYDQKGYLVACSMLEEHGAEHVRSDGLVEGHAYSILAVADVEGFQLLYLRNPWGNDKKWNGAWCDGDEAWVRHPQIRQQLRPKFLDDGAFWIAWGDFKEVFDFVYVCACSMRSDEDETRSRPFLARTTAPSTKRRTEAYAEELPELPVGTRVELIGVPNLEGRIVEILRPLDAGGQYVVRGVPSPYWSCPKCGEVNLRRREACNVCGCRRDPAVLEERDIEMSVDARHVVLPPGTEVQLHGLLYFPELNGQHGTIITFDRSIGRYHVELDDGRPRAVRPPHVIARSPPEEEMDFTRWVPPPADPSFIDEPEPPQEIQCDSDAEVRQLLSELDGALRLKREKTVRGQKLAKGSKLIREGPLSRGLAELRRGGLQMPFILRFVGGHHGVLSEASAGHRHAAYLEGIRLVDTLVKELQLKAEARGNFRLSQGLRAPRPPIQTVSRFKVGDEVECAKAGLRKWVRSIVREVDASTGELLLSSFPGYWMSRREQMQRLRLIRPESAAASIESPELLPSESAVTKARREGLPRWVCPECGFVNDIAADWTS